MVEKFLIDSNSFMTPYRQYYAFDLVPTYWEEISKCTSSRRLVLLDIVKAEIDKGEDDLADWISRQAGFVSVIIYRQKLLVSIKRFYSIYKCVVYTKNKHYKHGLMEMLQILG